jgi:hypothetical protein
VAKSSCEIAAVRLHSNPRPSVVVHESQFNEFSHADGLKSIPLLKKSNYLYGS